MKSLLWKRTLCCLLSMILILGNLPVFSFAEESDGLCEHHTFHTSECGYSPAIPGSPCTHEHTQDCYQTVAECIHVHDDTCGYNEEAGDASCAHVCSEEYGCFRLVPDCRHAHDESCGYVEATPEQPCAYACTECAEPGEYPSEPEEDPSESEEDPSEPSEPEVDEAVEAVRALIEALPTLEEIKAMSTQEQSEVYTQVQKAYDAYDALTSDQKAQLPEAEEIFTSLFEYFNSLTAPTAAHSHAICGESSCSHGHSSSTWTAWNGTSSIGSNYYYLTQDVVRTTDYYINGDVAICLNGHTLSTDGQCPVFVVNKGAHLFICDCIGGGKLISDEGNTGSASSGEFGIENHGGVILWSGCISGNWTGVECTDGNLSVYGGTIESRSYEGITLSGASTLKMTGGVVSGAPAVSGTSSTSKITVSGGRTVNAKGISIATSGSIVISGGTVGNGVSGHEVYLSGKPSVPYVASDSAVVLSDNNGNSYIGSGFTLNSSVSSGSIAVTQLPDQKYANQITVTNGTYTGLMAGRLTLSGTDALTIDRPLASGSVGTSGSIQWALYDNGDFYLLGSGAMPDYSSASYAPWYSYSSRITSLIVSDGITGIGSNAFRGSGLESVSFGNASLTLGNSSFAYCDSLTSIDFGSGTIQPGEYVFKECTALTSVHVPQNVVMNGSYSGIGSGLGMFTSCSSLQTATVDCGYVGPFFLESCYGMTQATFTNPDVQFYFLKDNSGHPFNAGSRTMNVNVVGYLCSQANVLVQMSQGRYNLTLTFSQIAGDTTQHTEKVLPGTATCTEAGMTEGKVCSVCGYVIEKQTNLEALGHDLHSHAGKAATCLETGWKAYETCSRCDYTTYEEIPATGHTFSHVNSTPATCVEEGVKEHYHCSVCGKDFEDENGATEMTDTSIPTKPHTLTKVDGSEPTCTEDGVKLHYHCSFCGKDYEDENGTTELNDTSIPAEGHSLTKVGGSEPTCTDKGVKEHFHCSVCGKDFADENGATEMTDTTIPTVEHEWGAWEVTTPATPEADGEETRKCASCQQEETRPLAYTGNRVELAGTGLENEQVVWIDGVAVPVQKDGSGNSYVTLPENSSSILVTYSFNTGSGDRHTQYPTGMKVYRVEKTDSGLTVAHLPELDNLLQYSGCSIRIVGVKGIRMITSISKSTRSALMGDGLAGYKLVEYGTAICRASALEGGAPMVLGTPGVKSNYAYKRGVADPIFKDTGSLIQYTNVLVGFTDEDCKEDIAMRPYIILEDEKGETVTLYGGTVYRSIGYIAYQNRNAFAPGSNAYNYVWDIIHYVYEDQYDADYKG